MTASIRRETWQPRPPERPDDRVVYVGRLEKVDIERHDFRISDDVGDEYSLPRIANDTAVMHLIGTYVQVEGHAQRDGIGRVSAIRTHRAHFRSPGLRIVISFRTQAEFFIGARIRASSGPPTSSRVAP